jgi:hypothetical protein
VFKKKAAESIAVLSSSSWVESADALESELNPAGEKPKKGSFEISVLRDDGKEVVVWSGLAKGPPRREKFPDPDVLLEATLRQLKK